MSAKAQTSALSNVTLKPAKAAKKAASKAAPKTFWEARSTRKIRGVTVSFYKRFEGSCYTMDFKVNGKRVRELTLAPVVVDAERVAEARVKAMQEALNGLAAAAVTSSRSRIKTATVADIGRAILEGDKVAETRTLVTYYSSLKRIAAVIDAHDPEGVSLAEVLGRPNLERFYSLGQGRGGKGVNWVDALDCNGGLNSAVRNVASLFTRRMLDLKFAGLVLPPLTDLRELPKLKVEVHGFQPWPAGVYEGMQAASEVMRTEQPELWLVNAMLRRLGLRDMELYMARREWIEVEATTGRAWLVIKNRGSEYKLLKHGRARKLELDEELKGLLLPKAGYLITAPMKVTMPGTGGRATDGLGDSARYDLIYRTHCEWMRQWIPDRTKANHELRMYAGSLIYQRLGLEAAAYFLGHKSTATTERYYVSWLGESPMLDGAAVAAAHG
jgi:integrase